MEIEFQGLSGILLEQSIRIVMHVFGSGTGVYDLQ